jgi:hypothetical protein
MDLLRFIEINQELGLPGLDNPLHRPQSIHFRHDKLQRQTANGKRQTAANGKRQTIMNTGRLMRLKQ